MNKNKQRKQLLATPLSALIMEDIARGSIKIVLETFGEMRGRLTTADCVAIFAFLQARRQTKVYSWSHPETQLRRQLIVLLLERSDFWKQIMQAHPGIGFVPHRGQYHINFPCGTAIVIEETALTPVALRQMVKYLHLRTSQAL
ncbi:MAG: hypothetical protein WCV85_00840 [Patescibacteria group bacterium]